MDTQLDWQIGLYLRPPKMTRQIALFFGRQKYDFAKLVSIKALALQNGLLPQGPAAKWIHT